MYHVYQISNVHVQPPPSTDLLFSGLLRKNLDSYDLAFVLCGTMVMAAAGLLFALPLALRRRDQGESILRRPDGLHSATGHIGDPLICFQSIGIVIEIRGFLTVDIDRRQAR